MMLSSLLHLQPKAREPAHHRHREELHYVDEYGQPVTVQVEGKRGRGHRRQRSRCAIECSVSTERHWEALRAMGLMEGEDGQGDAYAAGYVLRMCARKRGKCFSVSFSVNTVGVRPAKCCSQVIIGIKV